jgi:hypothetical protein
LIYQHVVMPLGMAKTAITVKSAPPVTRTDTMTGSVAIVAELARLMVRNRAKDGARFLPPRLYEQLVARQSWRMHPVSPRRVLGGEMLELGKRTYISPPPLANGTNAPFFVAFPKQGIAFASLVPPSLQYFAALKKIAADHFLPPTGNTRMREAKGLYDKGFRFNGTYVLSNKPSAWLADRLAALKDNTLTLSDRNGQTIILKKASGEQLQFEKQAPFLFSTLEGKRLVLSPYRQGGYLVLDGALYRFVGVLGNKTFVITIFPLVMLTLLSSALYLRSKTSPRWPKMAMFGFIGTLMVGAGLAGDYYLWPKAVFLWDMPWLVSLWRTILNIGLALVLSLPLFAVSFTRKNEMPTSIAIMIVPLHLSLISVAALMLFLILVAWGVAGEFSAF